MASYAVVVSQIYSEKQGPVGLCQSLFLQLFPVPKGFLGPFFILVLVNLPSAELSRLSLQKIPQNKGGNSRLISVIGFGPRDWATPRNPCWVVTSYMIPRVYRDIDSALVFTKPLDTNFPWVDVKLSQPK